MAEPEQARNVWGPVAMPRLLASVLCEDVVGSADPQDTRLTLQRVFFDLAADRFPARIYRCAVANVWVVPPGGGRFEAALRIVAPDGSSVAEMEGALAFPEGSPPIHQQMHYLYNTFLPEPGRYQVEVLLQGAVVHSYGLEVTGSPEPETVQEETE